MHNIHIIGNGFDLAHGMKTSYQDLLKDYLLSLLFGNQSSIAPGAKIISPPNTPINSNEIQNFNINDIFQLINPVHNLNSLSHQNWNTSKTTIFFENTFILELIRSNSNTNWVDVEQFYFDSMYRILKTPSKSSRIKAIKKLNEDFEQFKSLLVAHLKTVQVPTEIPQLAELIIKNCRDHNNSPEIQDLFINFNYTNTFRELYFSKIPSKGKSILNIHGNIEDGRIVFGHGDEISQKFKEIEDLNEDHFLKNIKSFDYLSDSNYRRIESIIDSTIGYKVFIYGHSCGISDRTLLNFVFENKRCQNITIHYYKNGDFDNYREVTYNISRNFRDKNLMRRRVTDKTKCENFPQLES